MYYIAVDMKDPQNFQLSPSLVASFNLLHGTPLHLQAGKMQKDRASHPQRCVTRRQIVLTAWSAYMLVQIPLLII